MVNLHKNAEKWRVAAELQLRVLLKHAEAEGVDVVHGNLKLSRSGHLRYFSATATTGQYCKLHQEVESVATSRPANSCTAHFRYDNKHMVQFSQIDRVAVLLPGWGGGIGMYACALPSLVREFDVVYCIDLPGMGLSSRDTFPGMAADVSKSTRFFSTRLEAGLAELQRRDARFARARHRVLGAHSLGGYIAVEWMLTKRIAVQLFCRLVLIAPAGVMGAPRNPTSRIMPHTHPLLAPLTDALWNKGVTPMSLIKRLPETLARTASRTFISQRLGRDMRPEQRTALREYLFQLGRAPTSAERAMCTLLHPGTWGRVPLIERLQLLTIPTAFVQGERDWMCSGVSEAAVEVMNAPYALKAVPRSGHNVFLDNPAGFTQVFAAVCDGLENFENLSPCTTLQHHERPQ